MDYILGPKPDGCVFCAAVGAAEDGPKTDYVLHRAPRSFVMLNRYPYSHAHIMILPNRHVSDLESLDPEEQRELFELTVKSQTAIRRALNPQGMNVGINIGDAAGAGIKDHLHVHVVPRWHGDTNFMPVLADTRTMPEHLDATHARLLPYFDEL
jgi:ATP adenylyltransferase